MSVDARGERRTRQGAQAGRVCTLGHRRGSVRTMPNDTLWTGAALDDLRSEFGDAYEGRTVLVTGADGFMGSHLTDALVELGATVHAFVRATSSGALNNIGHLREPAESALRRPHRPHVGRLSRARAQGERRRSPVRLPPRRAGARRRVLAPSVRDRRGERPRNAQPPAGRRRRRPRAREVRHGRHVGGVRERASTPSRTITTSTRTAASSSTSARPSTRSRSTRRRRSRRTS